MRSLETLLKLAALAMLLTGTAGCPVPLGDCFPKERTIAPGEKDSKGIDPRPALDALTPQSRSLRWVQINETTQLTITTSATDMPSTALTDCEEGKPYGYRVPATIKLETADGRLNASANTQLEVDGNGALTRPVSLSAYLPASTFSGAGVVSPAILDPVANTALVHVSLEIVEAGAGVAYGGGTLALSGNDLVTLAVVNAAP